jgi:hypothetical protein
MHLATILLCTVVCLFIVSITSDAVETDQDGNGHSDQSADSNLSVGDNETDRPCQFNGDDPNSPVDNGAEVSEIDTVPENQDEPLAQELEEELYILEVSADQTETS